MQVLVENLGVVYLPGTPLERRALSGVNLAVDSGSFVAVIGPTGSGKSTLIQCLSGLIRPTEGFVQIGENRVGARFGAPRNLRRHVGVVFQYPEHQLFEETVIKDIAFGPLQRGLSKEEAFDKAREAMRLVGLPAELEERSPFELSGGQMRRAAIAGILALEPSVLILDEPTAGLDPRGREEILELVSSLHRERGLTVWMVTHDMDEAAKYADRLVVLSGGQVVLEGAPGECFAKVDELRRIGLELPEITRLVHDLNRQGGMSIPADLFDLDQLADELDRRRRVGT
jgi:energy-coupling factor transport system ATP-binding protein